jgi:hypothetical protein
MEKADQVRGVTDFELVSAPDSQSELFVKSVLEDIARPQSKQPLQCVTVKMPLPAYLRMKRAARRWNLTYTDLINSSAELVVPILEAPSGEVATMLEQHRLAVEQKRTVARSARAKAERTA